MSEFVSWHRFFYKQAFIKPCLLALQGVKGKVLDLGCGEGIVTRTLAQKRKDLDFYGIDLSQESTMTAQKWSSKIQYQVGKAEKIPFPKDYFSAVVSFEVLEHLADPDQVLKEVNRVLKPKGIFYLTTPLEGDPLTLYGFLYYHFGYDPHRRLFNHIQKFSYSKLAEKLKKSGFEILSRTFCAHYFNQLYRVFLTGMQKKFGDRLVTFLLPLTYGVNLFSGIESLFLRKRRGGLDVQIICQKVFLKK